MDIDDIQAHGVKSRGSRAGYMGCLVVTGVGAADITKLKANGYYTVAVSLFSSPHKVTFGS